MKFWKTKSLVLILLSFFIYSCSNNIEDPVSIIFCIGDGMGFEQIRAANFYYYGEEGRLSFQIITWDHVMYSL